jgi:hypothetical protein
MKLEDFSRALREEADAPDERAGETRARVIAKLDRVKRRRAKHVVVVLPIAAVLAGATASAAIAGKWPAAWHSFARVLQSRPRSTAAAPVPAVPALSTALTARTAADATPPESSEIQANPPVEPPRTAPKVQSISKSASAPAPAPPKNVEPAEPSASDSLALYRAAHHLHFSEHDSAAALVAWDAYLARDPAGAFAPEARYNRALCLVRLGRTAEAREALAPFASGVSGGYRRSEARALLSLLDRGSEDP